MSRIPTEWELTGAFHRESGQAWVDQVVSTDGCGPFAFKQLKNTRRRERFSREVQTMARLRKAGVTVIPPVIAADLEGPRPWFVMPWYVGGSLETLAIEKRAFINAPESALLILQKIAEAFDAVHRAGVAHRDGKPANVLMDADGVVLSDFGLCLQVDDDAERITALREAVGSRLYVAPENERGINEDRDQRPADFYAFGKMVWAVLAGDSPPAREDQLRPENHLGHVLGDARYDALLPLQERLLLRREDRLSDWSAVITELGVASRRFGSPQAATPPDASVIDRIRRVGRRTELQRQIHEGQSAAKAADIFVKRVVTPLSEGCSQAAEFLQGLTVESQGVLAVEVAGLAEPTLVDAFEQQPLLTSLVPGSFDPAAKTPLWRPGPVVAYQVRSPLDSFPVRALLIFYASVQVDGTWFLSFPLVARGTDFFVPEHILEEGLALSGPHPQGLEQTSDAAREFGAAGLDRFLSILDRYAEGIEESVDLFEAATWEPTPIYQRTRWCNAGRLRVPRSHHASVVIGGSAYALGGQIRDEATTTVETTDGSQSVIPELPSGRLQFGACVDGGGVVYVFGGTVDHHHDPSLLVLPRGDRMWREARPMCFARSDFGAACGVDGNIYVAGGMAYTGTDGIEATVERYSPDNENWEVIAALSVPRRGCAAAVIGNRLHVAGGVTRGGAVTGSLEVVDLSTGAVEQGSPLQTPRAWCSGVAGSAGHFYVLGGHDRREVGDGYLRCVEAYDPDRQEWTALDPLRVRRASFSAVALGDALLAVGGECHGGVTASVERLPLT